MLLVLATLLPLALHLEAQSRTPRFRVIALAEHGGIHKPFVDAAKVWLGQLGARS